MKRLLLLIVFAMYGGIITAQESRVGVGSNQVLEYSAYIANLRSQQTTSRTSTSGQLKVEKLLGNVQQAVYVSSGQVKTYGEQPKVLVTDFQSLSGLNNPAIVKENIQLATINLTSANLNGTIDWSVFSEYPNLRYIHIVSKAATTAQNMNRMAGSYPENYSVFYRIEKGE